MHRAEFLSAFRIHVVILLVFVALTIITTYPQALYVTTSVPDHEDPYYSMWGMGWVAHEIVRDPRNLFEANNFFPEHDTLTYSDAMLLPAIVVAPLFWSRINPVAIYNIALLMAFALSGLAAFVLARRLTGSIPAAVVAGVVFAFAPYRFTHYAHLELQCVFWMPLALLLIHKMAAEGRLRDGFWLGLVMAAQAFSSVYMFVFLATYIAVFVPVLMLWAPPASFRRFAISLFVAASLTLGLTAPYAEVYRHAERTVGHRSLMEVSALSASLQSYAQAPHINRLYGSTATTVSWAADELNLFPGLVALVVAGIGLILAGDRLRFVYLAGLLFAFDFSRGTGGLTYALLYHYVLPFRGLRGAARFDILVNLSLAMLGAYGVSSLLTLIERPVWRRLAATIIVVGMIIEYSSRPALLPAPVPSQVDAWLAHQPPVTLVELPLSIGKRYARDWIYMYQSIGHYQKLLNGYSAYRPPSYFEMIAAMAGFPDDRSIDFLRKRHVDYVVLRGEEYHRPDEWSQLLARVRARTDLSFVTAFSTSTRADAVYAVVK